MFTKSLTFCLKRSKILRVPTQHSLCFSPKFCACVFLSNAYKKLLRNSYFFLVGRSSENKAKTKQKIKNPSTSFRHCYLQHMRKILGKNSKSYFSWTSRKFLFFKQITWFFVTNKSLSKITHQYFSVQCRYDLN